MGRRRRVRIRKWMRTKGRSATWKQKLRQFTTWSQKFAARLRFDFRCKLLVSKLRFGKSVLSVLGFGFNLSGVGLRILRSVRSTIRLQTARLRQSSGCGSGQGLGNRDPTPETWSPRSEILKIAERSSMGACVTQLLGKQRRDDGG